MDCLCASDWPFYTCHTESGTLLRGFVYLVGHGNVPDILLRNEIGFREVPHFQAEGVDTGKGGGATDNPKALPHVGGINQMQYAIRRSSLKTS